MSSRLFIRLSVSTLFVLVLAALVLAATAPVASQGAPASMLAFTPTPTRTATATPGPPPPPILTTPSDGMVTTVNNYPPLGMPTLRWLLPTQANVSHFQISNTPGFSTVLVESDSYTDNYTPQVTWVDGTYYWRVKSGAGVGSKVYWGVYSDVFTFQKNWTDNNSIKPLLEQPEPDAHRSAFQTGDFTWHTIPGAAGYTLEISSDPAFTTIVYKADTLRPQHMPEKRLQSNLYYWRVTPFAYVDNSASKVVGTPSDVRQFTVDWNTPPLLLAPADQADLEFTPRFQWTAVEGADHYMLEVSSDVDFAPSSTYTTRNTDFTPTAALANDKEYFWRVKAYDYIGNTTQWSLVSTFHAKWNLAPQLLTPANNQTTVASPYFSWVPVPGAERYQIQIDLTNQFNPPVIDSVSIYNVADYTQPEWKYVYFDRSYFWRVRALDAQGNYTPWSETWAFELAEDMPAPSLIYPPTYYVPDVARTPVYHDPFLPSPVFVWNATHHWPSDAAYAVGPDHYELTVDDDPGFGSPNFHIETHTLAAAPTATHPFALAASTPTLYYWRVRAFGDAADTQQWGTDTRWVFLYTPPPTLTAAVVITPPSPCTRAMVSKP